MTTCDVSELPKDWCGHCRGEAPEPRSSVMYRFTAKFGSPCDSCGEWIHEGDLVARMDDGSFCCEECAT